MPALPAQTSRRRNRLLRTVLIALLSQALAATGAWAQADENPVYVDDSPRAWQLFRQAEDQSRDNPGEAARVYQELLGQYALKIIPTSEASRDHFSSVRSRVNTALLNQPAVLERYRMLETPHAQRMLEAGELRLVITTRFLTEPALEAALRLAQQEVENGRFASAASLLIDVDPHPDLLGRRALFRWFLLGLSANALENTELRQIAIDALAESPGAEARMLHDELMRLLRAGPLPAPERGLTVLDDASSANPEHVSTMPIWSVDLENALLRRHYPNVDFSTIGRGTNAGVDATRIKGDWLTIAPTVTDRAVYVNEGQVVRAFDRFSQREFWRQTIDETPLLNVRRSNQVSDLSIVTVEGDSVLTLSGHATPQERQGSGRLVCLDAATGRTRWSLNFNGLNDREEYEGLFPHGAPVVAEGVVYVLARKVTRQSLMSTYAVAVDLHETDPTRRVRWVRYIASSGGLQQNLGQPYSSITYKDGSLYVSANLGAVARLAANDGEVEWLRRLDSFFRPALGSPPWEMTAPCVVNDWVFVLSPDQLSILVLDRTSGAEIARIDASKWGSPRYLIATQGMVYGVGDDLRGVTLDMLEDPLWRLSDSVQFESAELGTDGVDLRGRVQVAGEFLVAPTNVGLLYIDAATGSIRSRIPLDGASNPLALGSELYLASSDRLEAFIPVSVAEAMLRQQIEAASADPQPALSLLRLAAKGEESEQSIALALEAASLASDALGRMQAGERRNESQAELFGILLDLAERTQGLKYETGLALHGMIGSIASGPQQQIEHLLARGDWLAALAATSGRHLLADAIETYQTILSDPTLAAAERRNDEVVQPASTAAIERLSRLLSRYGIQAYAPLEADAAARLASLDADASPSMLLEIVRQFPFAEASRRAANLAAAGLADAGRPREALSTYVDLYHATAQESDLPVVIASIVELCEQQGWLELASHWLTVAEREGFAVLPALPDGAPKVIDDWRAELGEAAFQPSLPTIEAVSAAAGAALPAVDGRLLPRSRANMRFPGEYALILNGSELSRVQGPALHPLWRTTLSAPSAELVGFSDQRLHIWLSERGGELVEIDPSDGNVLWQSGPLQGAMLELRGAGRRSRLSSIDIGNGTRRVSAVEVIALPSSSDLVAVGRSGGLQRLPFANVDAVPIWQTDHPLEAVHFAARHDLAIVLAGEQRFERGRFEQRGIVALIDPQTGETLRLVSPIDGSVPSWLFVTPRGVAVFGSTTSIEAVDLASGSRLWANVSPRVGWFTRTWYAGDRLLLSDEAATLQAIDLADGRLSHELRPWPDVVWQPRDLIDVQTVGDRILAHYLERVVWFDAAGGVDGQDSIATDRRFTHTAVADDRIVVVSHIQRPFDQREGRDRSRSPFINRVYIMSHNSMVLEAFDVPSERSPLMSVTVIDGAILLSDLNQTIAIPAGSP